LQQRGFALSKSVGGLFTICESQSDLDSDAVSLLV
jgi:hypothetical protein